MLGAQSNANLAIQMQAIVQSVRILDLINPLACASKVIMRQLKTRDVKNVNRIARLAWTLKINV